MKRTQSILAGIMLLAMLAMSTLTGCDPYTARLVGGMLAGAVAGAAMGGAILASYDSYGMIPGAYRHCYILGPGGAYVLGPGWVMGPAGYPVQGNSGIQQSQQVNVEVHVGSDNVTPKKKKKGE